MFGRKWSDSNIWKDKVTILMFEMMRQEFHCFEGQDKNSSLWKVKVRIPLFGRIR